MTEDDVGGMNLSLEVTKGVIAKFFQAILGFAGTILFARILGPSRFGGFYLVLSLVQMVDWPTSGFARAIKKRFSESEAPKRRLVGLVMIANTLYFAFVAVLGLGIKNWLASYTGIENTAVFFLVMFGAMLLFYPFQRMASAVGRVSFQVWNDTARSVLTFGLQVLFVAGLGFGVSGMVAGWALSTVMVVPVIYYVLRVRPALPTMAELRSVWQFARYSILSAVLGKAYNRYDVLLIGLLITPAAAGQYEVAYKLVVPATFVSSVLGSGLMAKVSNLDSKNESVAIYITNSLTFASILAIPLFFGAMAIPKVLVVTAYGSEYRSAATLLVGLALYQVFKSQSTTLTQSLSGIDRPKLETKIAALTLGINVALGFILVLRIGSLGVVIATVIAEGIRYAATGYVLKRYVPGIKLIPRPLILQILAGAIMYVSVRGLRSVVTVDSWVPLGALIGAGAATYGLALIIVSGSVRNLIFETVDGIVIKPLR